MTAVATTSTIAQPVVAGGNERPGPRPGRSALAFEGMRHMTPMALGIVPFGVAVGAEIASADIGLLPALASGPVILAGAAQLATLQMLESGASPIVIVASALLINLRILLYGTTLAPWFAGVPLRRRLLLAVPVIDQTHLLCLSRFREGDLDLRGRIAYYAGAGSWLIVLWIGSQLAAVALGTALPAEARLDMAAPLAMVGLLARSTPSRVPSIAAVAALAVAAGGAGLPFRSSTLVAILLGIAVAMLADRILADRASVAPGKGRVTR